MLVVVVTAPLPLLHNPLKTFSLALMLYNRSHRASSKTINMIILFANIKYRSYKRKTTTDCSGCACKQKAYGTLSYPGDLYTASAHIPAASVHLDTFCFCTGLNSESLCDATTIYEKWSIRTRQAAGGDTHRTGKKLTFVLYREKQNKKEKNKKKTHRRL